MIFRNLSIRTKLILGFALVSIIPLLIAIGASIKISEYDLKEEVNQALEYKLDLTVIQIIDEKGSIFKKNAIIDKLRDTFKNVYPFSPNNIFIIENSSGEELNNKIESCTKDKKLVIKKMKLGSEFTNFADFFDLYR